MKGFFKYITQEYGAPSTAALKRWNRITTKFASLNNRNVFLLQCKKHSIYPRHIFEGIKCIDTLLHTHNKNLQSMIFNFNKNLKDRILKVETNITNDDLRRLEFELSGIKSFLRDTLPSDIVQQYHTKQKTLYFKIYNKIKTKNLKKLKLLLEKQYTSMLPNKPSWVRNLSQTHIPQDILQFLSLGEKFSIIPTKGEISIARTIADIESIISECEAKDQNILRAKVTNILTNYFNKDNNSVQMNYFREMFTKTQKFLKQNPELVITRADKGSVCVILDRNIYNNLSNELLSDKKYYKKLTKDPTTTIQNKINKLVKQLHDKNYINDDLFKNLTTYSSNLGRFYGLPKIHKPTLQLRPIISCIDTATANLSKFVADVLSSSFKSKYGIRDSFEFAEKVKNLKIPDDYVLISLDVVSLFTNIPEELVISVLANRWENIEPYTSIPKEQFLDIVKLIFQSCVFVFNGDIYKQVFGTAMGSASSVILSALVMEEVFDNTIAELDFEMQFVYLFVDDCLTCVPKDKIDYTLNKFNSYNENIKFTLETEDSNRSIAFLDTLVIRNDDNILELNWFQKATHSNRYINFNSFHSPATKLNTIVALKNRILKICSEKFVKENLKKLTTIFTDNGFPLKMINKLIYSTDNTSNLNSRDGNPVTYKSIPNIPKISEKIKHVFSGNERIKLALKNQCSINSLYTRLKDPIPIMHRKNVIYSISCTCGMKYIGHTQQKLQSRLAQHKSDERRVNKINALSSHVRQTNHLVNYGDVTVLATEPNLKKRLWLEMYYIQKQQDYALNNKTDTANLNNIYCHLIDISR